MISGKLIEEEIKNGSITIENFDKRNLNPNSYNLSLSNMILTYDNEILNPKIENKTIKHIIPDNGIILHPGTLYLASTQETVSSTKYIPCISGRSSLARLGLVVHQTAFFANFGDVLKWTLELSVVQPFVLYPDMKICQMYFEELAGPTTIEYNGKYKFQDKAIGSKFYEEEAE